MGRGVPGRKISPCTMVLRRGVQWSMMAELSHVSEVPRTMSPEQMDGNENPRILVVGGNGNMGRRFVSAFRDRGCTVQCLDLLDDEGRPVPPAQRAEAVRDADIVMLAVPMGVVVSVAEALGPDLRPDALFCDINSLKEDVCAAMARSPAAEVLGLHPMFGPTVSDFDGQTLIVCPVRVGPRGRWLRRQLAELGLVEHESSPEAHDRMMAVVQVLVHFRTLVMGETLRRSGIGIADSLNYTSPIYRLELAFVGRLYVQDPGLYAEIEMQNPYGPEVRRAFVETCTDLKNMLDEGDRTSFRTMFSRVREYFGDFGTEAHATSDAIIDHLVTTRKSDG